MPHLYRLMKMIVMTACVLWFLRTPVVHAQYGGECIKQFETTNDTPCFDCCPMQPQITNLVTGIIDASAGVYSSTEGGADCGGGTCNGGSCGTTNYFTAQMDSECCLPSGTSPCSGGTCCPGLQCLSNNSCGVCAASGQYCSDSSDCCSLFCDTGTHTCQDDECGLPGDECDIDGDCCSYACSDGYCE